MYQAYRLLLAFLASFALSVPSVEGTISHVAERRPADMTDPSGLVCEPGDDGTSADGPQEPHDLIIHIGTMYGVPPGILYAIWQKETRGLEHGWGTGLGWFKAYRLSYANGRCVEAYGPTACWNNWLRLKAICGQLRENGEAVCDPMKVRTAYGLEMGPMMFLPSTLLRDQEDGVLEWTRYATDFDSDGVVDPHDLADAMASAAKYLRHNFDRKAYRMSEHLAWRYAIIRYNGAAEYYYGKPANPGILHYWNEWCRMPGNCMSRDTRTSEEVLTDSL